MASPTTDVRPRLRRPSPSPLRGRWQRLERDPAVRTGAGALLGSRLLVWAAGIVAVLVGGGPELLLLAGVLVSLLAATRSAGVLLLVPVLVLCGSLLSLAAGEFATWHGVA
jgi:hypothetical protein